MKLSLRDEPKPKAPRAAAVIGWLVRFAVRTRPRRVVFSFTVVLCTFWTYRLIAVPLLEPTIELGHRELTPEEDLAAVRAQAQRHLENVQRYFRPGEWELDHPMLLESQRATLLLKDYQTLPDGLVHLKPCTLLFYPKQTKAELASGTPPRAIILQAQEATLKFDRPINLSRGEIGKPIGGHLNGPITIRGAPSAPGKDDGIFMATRDVQLSESRIWTVHPVQFRFGQSHGSGRYLQINLMPSADAGSNSRGLNIGGVDSLELLNDVRMRLTPGAGGLMPGDKQLLPASSAVATSGNAAQLPVDVSCRGRFEFNVVQNLATFRDQVDVIRSNPSGPADQINCEYLAIKFAPASKTKSDSAATSAANLEPQWIEARGNPVVVHAPSSGAHARGQRLEYVVPIGQVTLEGNEGALLTQDATHIQARRVVYIAGPPGKLGQIDATGPGWFRGKNPDDSTQDLQATWQQSLRLRPHEDQQVLSLTGGAEVGLAGEGKLTAANVHLWLLELPPLTPATPTAENGPAMPRLLPDRLRADGTVQIQSSQLTGRTELLELWFKHHPPKLLNFASGGAVPGASSTYISRGGSALGRPSSSQQFDISGRRLRVQLGLYGTEPEAELVTIDGDARLVETQTSQPGEAPLVVTGEHVQAVNAASPSGSVVVKGAPGVVDARGMKMIGADIQLDRAANQLAIRGPGQMVVLTNRDLNGNQLATPVQVLVDWKESMVFDGLTATCRRGVQVKQESRVVRTEQLMASLMQRIDFSQPPQLDDQRQATQLRRIECRGGFTLDNQTAELGRVESIEHLEAGNLGVDMASGEMTADGPGWMTRVGYQPQGAAALPAIGSAQPVANGPPKDQLSYLRIDFQQGLTGNIHRRETTFHQQVKTVYGPVAAWTETIDPGDPRFPKADDVYVECDALTVADMKLRPSDPSAFELRAVGNASVEHVQFSAYADRITYDQTKDQIVMEGDGRSDVRLYRAGAPGGAPSMARRILFNRRTGHIDADAVRGTGAFELSRSSR